jgi:excisionase family DNA binding protein
MVFTEKFYTVPEAAEQLRLSPWTIWDLLKRGELVRTKIAGKTFVRESEMQKLIVDTVNPISRVRKGGGSR